MPLVSDSIPNLIGGISQQAPSLRTVNSAKDLKNAYPSVVNGLQKRPPSSYVAKLYTSPPADGMKTHIFNRIGKGTDIVTITNGDLKVFNSDGTEETVNFPDGKSYLTASEPEKDFRCLTIADTVFVLNKTKTVTTTSVAEDGSRLNPETTASIYIKQAVANKNYSVYINNSLVANFLTNNSSVEGTDTIASNLATTLSGAGYTAVAISSTVSITGLGTGDVVRAKDGFGDAGTRAFKDTVSKFSDLPPYDAEGRLVRVQGDVEEVGDDYYVVFNDGVWVETFGYGENIQLTDTTMPHILVDGGAGTWTFQKTTWPGRVAGDSESAPDPTFVNQTLQSLFVYKNRMVLLTDENVVMSKVGEFETFYRQSLVQLLDSEPIDVASTNIRVSNMYHGVPFNENLLLFSDKTQFKLTDSEILSPRDVQMVIASQYKTSTVVEPKLVGSNVVFVDDADTYNYASVREYYISNNEGVGEAANITVQVPKLLPSGVTSMTTSTNEEAVAFFTSGDPNGIYIYKYYWGNEGKVQSAWTLWEWSEDTEFFGGEFQDNDLYLIVKKTEGVYLEIINFQGSLVAEFDNVGILLDRKTNETVSTPALVGSDTVITLPYELQGSETVQLVTRTGSPNYDAGVIIEPSSTSGNTATFVGVDLTSENYYIGVPYTFEYELNPIYLRDGEQTVQDGRLQMRYLSFLYQNTAYFNVEFTDTNGTTYTSEFTGNVFGSSNNILGDVNTEDGEFRVAIPGENLRINVKVTNDKPFPSNFSAVEWEAMYTPYTRRL